MSTIASRPRCCTPWGAAAERLAWASAGLLRTVSSSLLPPTCCLCGFRGMGPGFDLCEVCARLLPFNTAQFFSYPPVFSRALVPFEYAYPIDDFVRALKFRRERLYARVLGMLLARAQREQSAPLPQRLIPVPLHSSRYRSRGFNQAIEIARYAAAQLRVPVDTRCLARVRATREQSHLSPADRRLNVRGAFRLLRPVCAEHVALLDDVLTTGSTAAEAAYALAESGVEKIELWTLARVI